MIVKRSKLIFWKHLQWQLAHYMLNINNLVIAIVFKEENQVYQKSSYKVLSKLVFY